MTAKEACKIANNSLGSVDFDVAYIDIMDNIERKAKKGNHQTWHVINTSIEDRTVTLLRNNGFKVTVYDVFEPWCLLDITWYHVF